MSQHIPQENPFASSDGDTIDEHLIHLAGHELKNPLAAFSLQGRVIESMVKDNDFFEQRERIVTIIQNNERQIKRMELVINQMILLIDKKSGPRV